MRAGAALGLLLLAACQREEQASGLPALPPPQYAAVLDAEIARSAAAALPAAGAEEILAAADLLDLWLSGGRGSERAARSLEAQDAAQLSAALLGLLEQLDTPAELRRGACAWLRSRAVLAALPRLTLRLKYEKDWVANVDLALTLLRHGSGAGAEALRAILREESRQEPMYLEARARAAAALAQLPAAAGWTPGEFAADWQRLLDFEAEWLRERRAVRETPSDDPGLQAEIWRVLGWLRSQPLRPVDDARFILTRLPAEDAYAALLATARDQDFYARDHALETVSWIGAPFGAWAQRAGVDAVALLAPLLGDAALRPRVLEALGACALPRAAPLLLPWLRGTREESTAAADALLRCADATLAPELAAWWERAEPLPPEARFSLALLCANLDCAGPAPDERSLDPAEAARRREWQAARPSALD